MFVTDGEFAEPTAPVGPNEQAWSLIEIPVATPCYWVDILPKARQSRAMVPTFLAADFASLQRKLASLSGERLIVRAMRPAVYAGTETWVLVPVAEIWDALYVEDGLTCYERLLKSMAGDQFLEWGVTFPANVELLTLLYRADTTPVKRKPRAKTPRP